MLAAIIPRAMPWAKSFWAFSPFLNHMQKLYTFYNIYKEELTDEMPQANDIILAGDIKVDRGSFLAERLLRTFYD